jgi:hypothetical protein
VIGSPSSLVFAAIVGVWAVYLVPTWLRRRHELAQAQQAEARAARVLAPRRRAAVVSGPASSTSTGPVHAATTTPRNAAPRTATAAPGAAPRTAPAGAAKPAGNGAVRPPRSVREVAARAAARRRARVLTFLLLGTVGSWAVVGLDLLSWVAGVPATALLLLDLLALRMAARRRSAAAAPRVPAQARRPGPSAAPRREPVAPPTVSGEPTVVPAEESAEPAVEEPAASIGWTPVPVPLPLYTLKPMAPSRWSLPPRPVAPADPMPSVAEEDLAPMGLASLDLDAVLERRRAVNG